MAEKKVRILSLDGGGSWALIQALALEHLYGDLNGRAILSHFDFAFANSGGSIVLGGLVADKTPTQIVALFKDPAKRNAMFTRTRDIGAWLLRTLVDVGPRYRTEPKLAALRRELGDLPLASIDHPAGPRPRTCIVIVAYDYDRERAFFFRSAPSLRAPVSICQVAEAIHASTTAPVKYFDKPAELSTLIDGSPYHGRYWDGGVTGHNNPAAAAVAEALSTGVAPGDIALLSIGTANNLLPNVRRDGAADAVLLADPQSKTGLAANINKLASAVLGDPPDFASFLAHTALGGHAATTTHETITDTSVIRLNPAITPAWRGGHWDFPEYLAPAQFRKLLAMDMDATDQNEVDLIEAFARLWLGNKVTNQPIRFNFFADPNAGMFPEVGHIDFNAAVAAWKAFAPDGLRV